MQRNYEVKSKKVQELLQEHDSSEIKRKLSIRAVTFLKMVCRRLLKTEDEVETALVEFDVKFGPGVSGGMEFGSPQHHQV